jgi:hypothetical protein
MPFYINIDVIARTTETNKIYVGLFLIRQNLSGGVRLLGKPTLVQPKCQE